MTHDDIKKLLDEVDENSKITLKIIMKPSINPDVYKFYAAAPSIVRRLLTEGEVNAEKIADLEKKILSLEKELEATRGCCWNPNVNECEFCRKNRAKIEKLEAVRKLAEDVGECECYDEYGERLMSSPCKYCRLQQVLAEIEK